MRAVAKIKEDAVGLRIIEDLLVAITYPLNALAMEFFLFRVRSNRNSASGERLK